jgi:hypothetical protein
MSVKLITQNLEEPYQLSVINNQLFSPHHPTSPSPHTPHLTSITEGVIVDRNPIVFERGLY